MTTSRPTRTDIHFRSEEQNCAAWLYLPDGAAPEHQVPIVVMGHGFTGVKEQRLDAFAERFVAAGYACCLVFDYRHFGGSEGMPRELVNVKRQLQDWRNAVAFARSLPEADADRVILWGTSFAGGHVLVTAAHDPGIRRHLSVPLHVFGRCGHWVQLERQAEFERHIIAFLGGAA